MCFCDCIDDYYRLPIRTWDATLSKKPGRGVLVKKTGYLCIGISCGHGGLSEKIRLDAGRMFGRFLGFLALESTMDNGRLMRVDDRGPPRRAGELGVGVISFGARSLHVYLIT